MNTRGIKGHTGIKSRQFKTINEEILAMDQYAAWALILGFEVEPFKVKSKFFTSPFRPDKSPNCCLKWHKKKMLFMDSADLRVHGADCVLALSRIANISTIESLNRLRSNCPTEILPFHLPPAKEYRGFTLKYKKRSWSGNDVEFFKSIKVPIDLAVEEKWIPVRQIMFNSKENPSVFSSKKTNGYVIVIGGHHKFYGPSENPKFLSTVPGGSIGGRSKLVAGLPLLINKSAKDHLVITAHQYNSRFIVNGESDLPGNEFLLWACKHFPLIIFLYDNDEAGIKASLRAAEHSNKLTGTNKFTASYLPQGGPKDPSEWVGKFKNLEIIEEIIEHEKHSRLLETNAEAYIQGREMQASFPDAEQPECDDLPF